MAITALPTPPSTLLPALFATQADAFIAALPVFVTEANILGANAESDANAASASASAAFDAYVDAAIQATDATAQAVAAAASAASAVNAPGTNATSTTSLTVGTGSKSLTIQTGKSIVVGMSVKIAYTTTPTTWMHGDVTAYNSGTGALDVTVDVVQGSGTQAAWTVSLSAPYASGGSGAAAGANSDITSLSGLTTPLSIAQGGTSATSSSAARTALAAEGTANKDATGGYAGLTLFAINFKNVANTYTSLLTNANTAIRTYTFPDRTGTIADNTDLALKATLSGGNTWSGTQTFTGCTLEGGGTAVLQNSIIKGYKEEVVVANTGTSYTIDCSAGNVFKLTMTGNCTFSFSSVPATGKAFSIVIILIQDATGSRLATWPGSINWGGTTPTLTTTAGKKDFFSLMETDGGTTWDGFVSGQNH